MALGLVSTRLGRSANDATQAVPAAVVRDQADGGLGAVDEQTQTEARITVTPVSGEGGLWAAYGRFEQPTAVPSPAVEPEPEPQPGDVQPADVQRPALPVPEPPAPRGADWRVLVEQYDWNYAEVEAVMRCESGFDPNAQNGTSIGLLQINTAAHPYTVSQMLDPVQNIAAAYLIWADSGWGPWSCKPY